MYNSCNSLSKSMVSCTELQTNLEPVSDGAAYAIKTAPRVMVLVTGKPQCPSGRSVVELMLGHFSHVPWEMRQCHCLATRSLGFPLL